MGRITIFCVNECNFCRQTKAALTAQNVPFVEINVEMYPEKRKDMQSLTGQLTVPQVFFNEKHVGGAKETLEILEEWDLETKSKYCPDRNVREHYIRMVGEQGEPADKRLSIPKPKSSPSSETESANVSSSRTRDLFKVDDKHWTTLEFTETLMQNMPRETLSYWGSHYFNTFKGCDGVTALQKTFELKSRDEAAQLGQTLQRKQYIHHVTKDHPFGDNSYYYRLQPFHTPNVLNTFRVWTDEVDEPLNVIHRLAKLWSKLEARHLNSDGMVDHSHIRDDPYYWKFEEEVCELQGVRMAQLDDNARKAFVINVYNLVIRYASVKVGVPASAATRSVFFDQVCVNIEGADFSLNDLEHGILRANTRHPFQISKSFGMTSSKQSLALTKLDPRVHFALNCGARSCPPIKKYTSANIDEELEVSAQAFCEQDDNVEVDMVDGTLTLSKIFCWYSSDFRSEIPGVVAGFLSGKKKENLESLIDGGNLKVKYFDYDWSTNDVSNLTFERSEIRSRCIVGGKAPTDKYRMPK